MFFESENDPEKDPVIVWTNGGPGAASVYGLFVEMGPYQFTEESLRTDEYNRTGIPSLFRNPYSWTTFANVLILNSGGPTAWSYCDPAGPSGNASSCGVWNDTKTAWVNANFLE
jgi:carboxypeptidase C (cathepsin A)